MYLIHMAGVPSSVRIPEETKRKIKEVDIDWSSDYIRNAMEEKIRET
jgi:hypothetical protein